MTVFAIKLIAYVSMIIDHLTANLFTISRFFVVHTETDFQIYEGGRAIGRLAFPLFCFLLAEGVKHTRNRFRYALRIFIMAFVAEIPFDLALNGNVFVWSSQNVLFTLFLGVLVLYIIEDAGNGIFLGRNLPGKTLTAQRVFGYALAVIFIAGAALMNKYVLKADYADAGILAIAAMGLLLLPVNELRPGLRENPFYKLAVAAVSVAVLIFACNQYSPKMILPGGQVQPEVWAIFALPIILFYNGEIKNSRLKAKKKKKKRLAGSLNGPVFKKLRLFRHHPAYYIYPGHLLLIGLFLTLPSQLSRGHSITDILIDAAICIGVPLVIAAVYFASLAYLSKRATKNKE